MTTNRGVFSRVWACVALAAGLAVRLSAGGVPADPAQWVEGSSVTIQGRVMTLKKLESIAYVTNDYSRRFVYDRFENPKLKQLREEYQLDAVVAAGRDEFARQLLLMDWTHHQFKKFGKPTAKPQGALEILRDIRQGHTFFCAHYAKVLVSAAASLGWVDRELALRRHQGAAKDGSTEHSTTEIWSNQHRKWVMLDPTSNLYLEKEGVPLNAFEIRQEWFYHEGKGLVFVVGKEQRRYRKSDLPVFLARFAGFGDLAINPDELDKYGFTAYIPNTDFLDSGEDYVRMFIVKDKLCDGTAWHQRDLPLNPALDPYFPIGQASLSLVNQEGKVRVSIQTLTPNLQGYRTRVDGGSWTATGSPVEWVVHPGSNQLEVQTVNRFGVEGPISRAVMEVSP